MATKRRSDDGGRKTKATHTRNNEREGEQTMQKRTEKQQPTRILSYVQMPAITEVRPASSSSVQLTAPPVVTALETNDRKWNRHVRRLERANAKVVRIARLRSDQASTVLLRERTDRCLSRGGRGWRRGREQ